MRHFEAPCKADDHQDPTTYDLPLAGLERFVGTWTVRRTIVNPLIAARAAFIGTAVIDHDRRAAGAINATGPGDSKGAPIVMLVLLDDVGFGQFSVARGGVPSPAMEALAKEGLLYTRFHTTALCSPTRAALLTGRVRVPAPGRLSRPEIICLAGTGQDVDPANHSV